MKLVRHEGNPPKASPLAAFSVHRFVAEPWQLAFDSDWSLPCPFPFRHTPRHGVCRGIGECDYIEAECNPSDAEIIAARADVERWIAELLAADPHDCSRRLQRMQMLVSNHDLLRDAVRRWKGVAHPLATVAPAKIRTARGAEGVLRVAASLWPDRANGAIVQACVDGSYRVFDGLTTFANAAGADHAAILAYDMALHARKKAIEKIRGALPEWPDETPILGTTLGTLIELPVVVRRAPPAKSGVHLAPVPWLLFGPDKAVIERCDLPWDEIALLDEIISLHSSHLEAERATHEALIAELITLPVVGQFFKERGRLKHKKFAKPVLIWRSALRDGTYEGTLLGGYRRGSEGIEVQVKNLGAQSVERWIPASRAVSVRPVPELSVEATAPATVRPEKVRASRIDARGMDGEGRRAMLRDVLAIPSLAAIFDEHGAPRSRGGASVKWHDKSSGLVFYSPITGAVRRAKDSRVEIEIRHGRAGTKWILGENVSSSRLA